MNIGNMLGERRKKLNMATIHNFQRYEETPKTITHNNVTFNLIEEIEAKKERAASYGDEMVDVNDWDGECWKAFFEQVAVFAAELNDVDPWDFMAVMIPKMLGVDN